VKKPFILVSILISFSILILLYLVKRFPDSLNSRDNQMSLVFFGILLTYFILRFSQNNAPIKTTLQQGVVWIGFFFLVIAGYSYWPQIQQFWLPVEQQLLPSKGQRLDHLRSISFPLSNNGHYVIESRIEGTPLRLMVDTGASKVVLTQDDAERIGINLRHLTFNQPMQTANGLVFGAPITLREIEIGPITIENISAIVSDVGLEQSLLGMSFLEKLSSWRVDDGKLIMEQ
jgi:aspartyl protease family protein